MPWKPSAPYTCRTCGMPQTIAYSLPSRPDKPRPNARPAPVLGSLGTALRAASAVLSLRDRGP